MACRAADLQSSRPRDLRIVVECQCAAVVIQRVAVQSDVRTADRAALLSHQRSRRNRDGIIRQQIELHVPVGISCPATLEQGSHVVERERLEVAVVETEIALQVEGARVRNYGAGQAAGEQAHRSCRELTRACDVQSPIRKADVVCQLQSPRHIRDPATRQCAA